MWQKSRAENQLEVPSGLLRSIRRNQKRKKNWNSIIKNSRKSMIRFVTKICWCVPRRRDGKVFLRRLKPLKLTSLTNKPFHENFAEYFSQWSIMPMKKSHVWVGKDGIFYSGIVSWKMKIHQEIMQSERSFEGDWKVWLPNKRKIYGMHEDLR